MKPTFDSSRDETIRNDKQRSIAQTDKIQEAYLNYCRRQRINVVIRLGDQTVMNGTVVGFDRETVVVLSEDTQQLIYKSAIVCIRPAKDMHLIFGESKSDYGKKSTFHQTDRAFH